MFVCVLAFTSVLIWSRVSQVSRSLAGITGCNLPCVHPHHCSITPASAHISRHDYTLWSLPKHILLWEDYLWKGKHKDSTWQHCHPHRSNIVSVAPSCKQTQESDDGSFSLQPLPDVTHPALHSCCVTVAVKTLVGKGLLFLCLDTLLRRRGCENLWHQPIVASPSDPTG